MNKQLYLKITAMLAGIALLSALVTWGIAPKAPSQTDGVQVVTSFYPVYIAALNVAGGVDGVTVTNLAPSTAGCVHDYTMTTANRAALETAQVLVINGASAEPFLDAVIPTLDGTAVIDLSAGQTLLESAHVHEHDHEYEHEHDDGVAYNSHLWVSPLRYRQQVLTLRDGLIAADPAHAAAYTANADAYIKKIDALWARMQQAAQPLTAVPSLLFHDSFGYLAEDLGLTVRAALNVGEDGGISSAQLALAAEVLRSCDTAVFWYDDQYTDLQYGYLQDIPAHAVVLRVGTGVTGATKKQAWLEAATAICEAMEAAV